MVLLHHSFTKMRVGEADFHASRVRAPRMGGCSENAVGSEPLLVATPGPKTGRQVGPGDIAGGLPAALTIFMRHGCAHRAWETAPKIERTPSNSRKQPCVDAKAQHLRSTGTAGVSPAAFPNTRLRSFVSSQSPTNLCRSQTSAARRFHAPWVRIAHGQLLRKSNLVILTPMHGVSITRYRFAAAAGGTLDDDSPTPSVQSPACGPTRHCARP